MEERPNYYAILPANVRYDETLTANEKLLYSEITALTQKTGECWATNNYFSELYKVSPQSISRCLRHLRESGYIKIELIYKSGKKEIEKRVIKPININVNTYEHNCYEGINNNVKENNTSINITSNNNKEYKEKDHRSKEMFVKFYNAYPKKQNKAMTEKWFLKNKPSEEEFNMMMDKLELFKKTDQWKDIKYIPMPSTWLNQKRYLDEIEVKEEYKPELKIYGC